MESGTLPPFLAGYGYLLVEHALATYLQSLDIERATFEPAIFFNPVTKEEHNTHTRIRVHQFFRPGEFSDLSLDGLRLLTLNDQHYFVSPELKKVLEVSPFRYLSFSEGLSAFAGSAT
ncbi:hypothetical protein D9M68_871470 [compost metagenome]